MTKPGSNEGIYFHTKYQDQASDRGLWRRSSCFGVLHVTERKTGESHESGAELQATRRREIRAEAAAKLLALVAEDDNRLYE